MAAEGKQALEEVLAQVARQVQAARHVPASTYRLQLSPGFTFKDAARIVPYLSELGVEDCYCSPYLKARPGSLHGYDIVDHGALNPELGDAEDYAGFTKALHDAGMGQILDFVPNHMGMFGNKMWDDVLENGRASSCSRFFDIDWFPTFSELSDRVLLPILGDLYGRVLEAGQLQLAYEGGAFFLTYFEHRLPIDPSTYGSILEAYLEDIKGELGETHPDYLEIVSIVTASRNLPRRSETVPERLEERVRETQVMKRRLSELTTSNSAARSLVDKAVNDLGGEKGNQSSFARLHELLERQAYRLSYWQVASDEINYRRFFVINDLIGLRIEDPLVFERAHRLVRRLIAEGGIDGLRIDHIDGLFDPSCYLAALQRLAWTERVRGAIARGPEIAQTDLEKIGGMIDASTPAAPRTIYLVVEKVLAQGERLPETWPVDGTTGYQFGSLIDQLFVDPRHRRALLETYREFTGMTADFRDVVYKSKNLLLSTAFSAPLTALAGEANRISDGSWQYRDFTFNNFRDAIREVISCFPIYRTYVDPQHESKNRNDVEVVNAAVREAKRRNPAMIVAVFDYLRDILNLRYPGSGTPEDRESQGLFVAHFQQLTGPVMAKGAEDTAFYVYNPLISLCEVGGNPGRLGVRSRDFHAANSQRLAVMPDSMLCTSTHDSKRSQDVRARIDVLSEIPAGWKSAATRWALVNRRLKEVVGEEIVPDSNDEYHIYQSLVGSWPSGRVGPTQVKQYGERFHQYVTKALREAKVHTSWVAPNPAYEEATHRFVDGLFDPSGPFQSDFQKLLPVVSVCGAYNSLSQVVLKCFSPGVPDIYQGDEMWTFNLADPDNRRPVDFNKRLRLLEAVKAVEVSGRPGRLAQRLGSRPTDDRLKLFVTWKSLSLRREQKQLFQRGDYIPLNGTSLGRSHAVAFMRRLGTAEAIVVVPRLTVGFTRKGTVPPEGAQVWGISTIQLPSGSRRKTYRNIFTGERLSLTDSGRSLSLADVLHVFPVAVLVSL